MKKKKNKGWLMATALLGLPKALRLMQSHRLSLPRLETILQSEVGQALVMWPYPEELKKTAGGWGSESLLPWAPLKRMEWADLLDEPEEGRHFDEMDAAEWDLWRGEQSRRSKRTPKRTKRDPEPFRSLWSSLTDIGDERGEKLRVALGTSSRDDKARMRRQLEDSSKGLLQAVGKLRLPAAEALAWNPSRKDFGPELADQLREAVRISVKAEAFRKEALLLHTWGEKLKEATAKVSEHREKLSKMKRDWRKESGSRKNGKSRRR